MKKIFVLILLIVCLISSCKLDIKVQTPSPVEPVATTVPVSTDVPLIPGDFGWGNIHGKITNAFTGAPIVGAIVTCEYRSYSSPSPCSGTATTDEDGKYVFESIYFHDTDSIKLKIQATGYQTHEITLVVSSFAMPNMEANFNLNRTP